MTASDLDDPLKPLDSVFEHDPLVTYSLADSHDVLSRIVLNKEVPVEVRQLFETAKNVSLYSWFNRRFHPVAALVAFTALEAALVRKNDLEEQVENSKGHQSLRTLLNKAISRSWLTEAGIENRIDIARARVYERKQQAAFERGETAVSEPTTEEIQIEADSMKILPTLLEFGPKLRNDLAHGRPLLYWGSSSSLRTTAHLINQLFPRKTE